MEKVTVKKNDLLQALRDNRAGHRDQFLRAQEGWKITIIEELDRRMEDTRNGKFLDVQFWFREPEDHTSEYDRVIRMVEMEIKDTIQMAEHEFAKYVMDDWDWKAGWMANACGYITTACSAKVNHS